MGVDCKVIVKKKDGTYSFINMDRYHAFENQDTWDKELTKPTSVEDAWPILNTLVKQITLGGVEHEGNYPQDLYWLARLATILSRNYDNIEHIFVQDDTSTDTDDLYHTVKEEML